MWLALEFRIDGAQAQALSDALLEEGALSVDVADAFAGTAAESPVFREPGEEAEPAFRDNRVIALFSLEADPAAALGRACRCIGMANVPMHSIDRVEEQDWVRLTQSQFAPIHASARIWIVPSWHEAPDGTALNIVLDPGLAFGTGSHATTRLCLDWLDRNLATGSRVVDYGCGSGILAIAAAKLGAGTVCGVDIDPQALVTSRYNAQVNRVDARFLGTEHPPPEPADVVVANILANPLKILAPLLAELVVPGGRIVLSGILPPQAHAVSASYVRWFEMEPPVEQEGWIRLCGLKRARLP